MKIAIIGGGLSGTLTAIHLLGNAAAGTIVYLVEQDRYKNESWHSLFKPTAVSAP